MEDIFQFHGRGNPGIEDDSIFVIEPADGTVLEVTIRIGAVDFLQCYCRRALADRWSVYLDHPFHRRSSPDLNRSWAECVCSGAFIFQKVGFQLVREEGWMRTSS